MTKRWKAWLGDFKANIEADARTRRALPPSADLQADEVARAISESLAATQ